MAVIGIALGVGAIVYAVSLRGGDETLTLGQPEPARPRPHSERRPRPERRGRAVGFELPATSPTATAEPAESFIYIPVLESSHVSWQRRLVGVVGLIVLVTAAAALLAGAVYQAGHVINDTIAKFLGG